MNDGTGRFLEPRHSGEWSKEDITQRSTLETSRKGILYGTKWGKPDERSPWKADCQMGRSFQDNNNIKERSILSCTTGQSHASQHMECNELKILF